MKNRSKRSAVMPAKGRPMMPRALRHLVERKGGEKIRYITPLAPGALNRASRKKVSKALLERVKAYSRGEWVVELGRSIRSFVNGPGPRGWLPAKVKPANTWTSFDDEPRTYGDDLLLTLHHPSRRERALLAAALQS